MLDSGTVTLDDQAWHADLAEWLPLHKVLDVDPLSASVYRPPLTPVTAAGDAEGRCFLYIPRSRLILMSLITLGVYEWYWMYMNWRYLKMRNHLAIFPFWRSLFAYFYIYSLLDAIKRDATSHTGIVARYAAGPLAAGWILLSVVGNVFGNSDDLVTSWAGLIISAPTFVFLLPVQGHVNAAMKPPRIAPRISAGRSGRSCCCWG